MTIWKYPLMDVGCQAVTMAAGAKILHVGVDPDTITCLWALVDEETARNPDIADEIRVIYMYGTGRTIANAHKLSYLGTVRSHRFMWHFFEEKP